MPEHTLIIARRAVAGFLDLTVAEKARLFAWVENVERRLKETLSPAPGAFNLGVNDGPAVGRRFRSLTFM